MIDLIQDLIQWIHDKTNTHPVIVATTSATPPVVVTSINWFGYHLSDIALFLTIVYTSLLIIVLLVTNVIKLINFITKEKAPETEAESLEDLKEAVKTLQDEIEG